MHCIAVYYTPTTHIKQYIYNNYYYFTLYFELSRNVLEKNMLNNKCIFFVYNNFEVFFFFLVPLLMAEWYSVGVV